MDIERSSRLDIELPSDDAPTSVTGEITRALHLVLPSLQDHEAVAQTLRMILQKRGIEIMRMGVPLQ